MIIHIEAISEEAARVTAAACLAPETDDLICWECGEAERQEYVQAVFAAAQRLDDGEMENPMFAIPENETSRIASTEDNG